MANFLDLQAFSFVICFICSASFCAELPADWKSRIDPAVLEETENRFNRSRLGADDIIGYSEDSNGLNTQADHTGRMRRDNYWIEMRQCIPFKLHPSFDHESRRLIETALDTISSRTSFCLAFKEKTTEEEYISISPAAEASVCQSVVGRIPGGITSIHLGSDCFVEGIIIHEVLHALGFYHEQCRPDRDNYVKIYDSHIVPPDMQRNFALLSNMPDHGVEYDLNSILHYPHLAFAGDTESPTILPKVRSPLVKMGQRKRLSPLDVIKVQRAYECIDEDYQPLTPNLPNRCEVDTATESPARISSRRSKASSRHHAASSVDVTYVVDSVVAESVMPARMSVCPSYRGNTPSGLVVLDVAAVAGYTFDCEQIRELGRKRTDCRIEQIDCDSDNFELHIVEIGAGVSVCFEFDCFPNFPDVLSSRPAPISVYRDEDRADKKTVSYSLL